MNILVAQSAGFCWGVRRAMDSVLEASARWSSSGPVQTLGPLIHNPQALDQVALRGVKQSNSVAEVDGGTVVIRAHGIPVHELRDLKERHRRKALRLINGTCPEVAKVQARIKRYASKGYFTVLLGTHGHAEAVAHESYATSGFTLVSNLREAKDIIFPSAQKVLVIAQTTFLVSEFDELAAHFRSIVPTCVVLNTICKDTWKRQREARDLCRRADYLVVIGGKTSNNTRHLVELAQENGKPFQWVECSTDLDLSVMQSIGMVGVLAGASTPNWTVDEVVETLEQAGRPSRIRFLIRWLRTVQLPVALGMGGLTFLLHRLLGWQTGWIGPLLPMAFHLTLCATLPFLDPRGLTIKGHMQEQFLEKHRWWILGFGGLAGLLALISAAALGLGVMMGTSVVAALAISYQRRHYSQVTQRIPALKDLGQALAPTLLAVGFPWIQGFPADIPHVLVALSILFSCALAIHGLRHLQAFSENRILGREILPVAIGSRATQCMAVALIVVSMGLLSWLVQSRT